MRKWRDLAGRQTFIVVQVLEDCGQSAEYIWQIVSTRKDLGHNICTIVFYGLENCVAFCKKVSNKDQFATKNISDKCLQLT